MKITVTNLGPIKKAEVDVAPLTIFIGPNNSGKSLLATTLYALLSARGILNARWTRQYARQIPYNVAEEMLALSIGLDADDRPEALPGHLQKLVAEFLEETAIAYTVNAGGELARAAGTTLEKLRRATPRRAATSVAITSANPPWQTSLRITRPPRPAHLDAPPDLASIWRTIPHSEPLRGPSPSEVLLARLTRAFLNDMPRQTKYLPAARSGILNSQKQITGSIIRDASLPGIKDQRGPSMTGVIADFLSEIIELDQRAEGTFTAEASRLEHEILHGEIRVIGDQSPEVMYRTGAQDYQIMNTSSMVSELAPVVLYLRHLLEPGDLLLIDEPEAHLHPAAQIAFASSMVRLVNAGLKVGLTTHSEFFLQQISNSVMAGALPEDEATASEVPDDRIDAELVGAYFFQPTDSGTVVRRLPVDQKQGIPEASFDAVTDKLYNQIIAIDRRMGGQE